MNPLWPPRTRQTRLELFLMASEVASVLLANVILATALLLGVTSTSGHSGDPACILLPPWVTETVFLEGGGPLRVYSTCVSSERVH